MNKQSNINTKACVFFAPTRIGKGSVRAMPTLKDVDRQGTAFITPQYFDDGEDIELNNIECLTLIELIETNPTILSLIEDNLQCVTQLFDGTKLLTTWVGIIDFQTHLLDLIIKAASIERKSFLTNKMKAWGQSANNYKEVYFDFIRK
ncbi:hypothetical protein TUM4438_31130 [Shewanella sairae]|uniref:Uncharacterized protein n=1 Tax=Shewanella sairae TaxID=190310 RepID=A0ABQ4PLS2_9GAMM|nr:hypothetical protein [Shewanella sairae]MCL1131883.1 hypothetical protein [Shewanella sairae]GIU48842.1 hypothetical protein TUM4438_31130 [Shewanella sairae]